MNEETATLQTKLRHVDIHNHWLREAAREGRIKVQHITTTEMVADGLTKALSYPAFEKFRRLVGIVDISELLNTRQAKEVTLEDLERLEDLVVRGESSTDFMDIASSK